VWFIEQLKPLLLPRTLNSAPEILPQDSHLIAVMFIDLDRFKVINDSLGHIVGDHLLASVGERLGQNIRTQDGLARFGGDEFAVLLRRLPNREDAFLVASRLVQSFQKPFEVQGHTFSLGISIGIVFGHKDYQVPEDILRDADLAMYQAKYRGGNCYTVFEEVMRPQAMQRLQLEQDLRQAITAEQLCLYYQPIWSLTDHTITGFESLLRWHHPDRGWISPAQFIVIAEETGFIHQLGWWAIEQAVTQFYRWQKTYPAASSLSLNINISAHQIKDRQFPQRFAKLITELDLDGRCLNLEITETSFLETAQYYPENFAFLRKLGVEICIDDFGVGYSSLSRLHRLQVDTIKIDRSFVMDIDVDPQKKAITGTIITLAHQLGAQIIAEGIESEAQQTHLINLKCPFGQGFYLAKPLPVDAASNLIATL
ncbi:MAG: bifunctional diguanylate cyclase/phosphodiesterase, partial [Cyanobacteria bacterium P01_H01_bin.15]